MNYQNIWMEHPICVKSKQFHLHAHLKQQKLSWSAFKAKHINTAGFQKKPTVFSKLWILLR